jgi:DNA polymerase I-like protein with 3'-5' exonuclease and polymerase domains
MLAHFMARYDDGQYVVTVTTGRKEDKTDVHSVNKQAAGFNDREQGKRFIYALLYGGGDFKLGEIACDDFTVEQRERFNSKYPKKRERQAAIKRLGEARRGKLMTNLPALGKLTDAVKDAAKRGYLKGLDGRLLHVRSEHAALNTLLQAAGACVMKRALVLFEDSLSSIRSTGAVVAQVAHIHDEQQIETEADRAEEVGRLAAESIKHAGETFNLRCPLKGNFVIGKSWAETH